MRNRKRKYPCEEYEDIYQSDSLARDLDETRSRKGIVGYRMKTITSGKIRECEIYPIFARRKDFSRCVKKKESRDQQRRLNRRNAQKKLIRLLNTNFGEGDIWATFTYSEEKLPSDEKAAHAFFRKYLRRLAYHMQKSFSEELKYIFVTEYLENGERVRIHHHCVTNFPDRDLAEKLWDGGARTQTRRLQPDEAGLEGLGRYITKGKGFLKKFARMWSASKNLKQPKVTVSDTMVTRRRAWRMGTDQTEADTFFCKAYPDYQKTFHETKFSEEIAGMYIYARFVRRECCWEKSRAG